MMTYTIGDTPTLSGQVSADLNGATIVVRVLCPDKTTYLAADGTGEQDGTWSAQFADGELVQPGWHDLEVHVTFATTETQTFAYDVDDVQMGFLARLPLVA